MSTREIMDESILIKKSVLDLFGGRERVLGLAREIFLGRLEKMSETEINGFQDYFSWDKEAKEISKLCKTKNPDLVSFSLYQNLRHCLKMEPLIEAAGEPDLKNSETKKYWENEMIKHPMSIRFKGDSGLRDYVRFRAVGEIARIVANERKEKGYAA